MWRLSNSPSLEGSDKLRNGTETAIILVDWRGNITSPFRITRRHFVVLALLLSFKGLPSMYRSCLEKCYRHSSLPIKSMPSMGNQTSFNTRNSTLVRKPFSKSSVNTVPKNLHLSAICCFQFRWSRFLILSWCESSWQYVNFAPRVNKTRLNG